MENCFHCGDPCKRDSLVFEGKSFCCSGCKTVYQILQQHDLSYYYELENTPGVSPKRFEGKFDFLENQTIANTLLEFNEQDTQVIELLIPSIHCSSCIWVLENLRKVHKGVQNSQVNFPKKTVRITFNKELISIYNLVKLLCNLGYEPHISLNDSTKKKNHVDKRLIYQLGVAGFAFGNIMFLSFPEYFEVDEFWLERFKHLFRGIMFAFSLPVVFFSGRDYFISAFKGVRSKILNIDIPIALGIATLFIRSSIDIFFNLGSGFFDSLAGLVFFLLLGKFFQQKTYAYLSFERDYKSYFPMAVTKVSVNKENQCIEEQKPVYELTPGDRIIIRNEELIPVDAIIKKGVAQIDYSFVTGESAPITKEKGDSVFAGGKQQGSPIELEVTKTVKQSYLTQLWSNKVFQKDQTTAFQTLTNTISKRFTIWVLAVALFATLFWLWYQPNMAFNVFTAVLIVACPCAIALAAPFTLGNLLRNFGKQRFYLKNAQVIEVMAKVDTLIFDKTGTLSTTKKNKIAYQGVPLSDSETKLLTSTLRASNHPLSRSLYQLLKDHDIDTLDNYSEEVGKGISGTLGSQNIKVGALDFVSQNTQESQETTLQKTKVHVATDATYKGFFTFQNEYRKGMSTTLKKLGKQYKIMVLSGDNEGEKQRLKKLLPMDTLYYFNQKPEDKLEVIKQLQNDGRKVMMIGDGLNDAGALAQSDVGIALSEDINFFSPACDGILSAERFESITDFLMLSKKGTSIIKYAFVFSLLYNIIGLGFAISGNLEPVIAAILMPLSSVSIVVFTTLCTYILSKRIIKK